MTYLLVRRTSAGHDVMSSHAMLEEAVVERDMARRLDAMLIDANTHDEGGVRHTWESPKYAVVTGVGPDLAYTGGEDVWAYFDDCAVNVRPDVIRVWHDLQHYQDVPFASEAAAEALTGISPMRHGWKDADGRPICPDNASEAVRWRGSA